MRVADFSFELPESLIARYPQTQRSGCRLLSLDGPSGELTHGVFTDILDKIHPGDLLVFNNTRVIPARVFGRKVSGGKIEVLVERVLDSHRVLAHVRASKSPKPGAELLLGDKEDIKATMVARHDTLFELEFNEDRDVFTLLNEIGHMPLPPYIDRPDEDADRELYQTVYSERPGAVAAPTAGLHFDEPLMDALKAKGVEFAFVTLHVGAGLSSRFAWTPLKTTSCTPSMPKCLRKSWMRYWRVKRAAIKWWPWAQRLCVRWKVRRRPVKMR